MKGRIFISSNGFRIKSFLKLVVKRLIADEGVWAWGCFLIGILINIMKCKICLCRAVYLCKCSTPNIPFCLVHYEEHYKQKGVHWIQYLKAGLNLKFFQSLINTLLEIRNRIIMNSKAMSKVFQQKVQREIKEACKIRNSYQTFKIIAGIKAENDTFQYEVQRSVHHVTYLIYKAVEKREFNNLIGDFVEKDCLTLRNSPFVDSKIRLKLRSLVILSKESYPDFTLLSSNPNEIHSSRSLKFSSSPYGLQGISSLNQLEINASSYVSRANSNQEAINLYESSRKAFNKVNYKDIKVKAKNGTVFEGNVINGRMEGKISMKFQNGSYYEGDTKFGGMEGIGIYTDVYGSIYHGEFKNSLKHGKGTLKHANGSFYDGEFKNGEKEGSGILKFDNGDIYVGEFLNGMIHGNGKLSTRDGFIYEGEFKNGQRDGRGTFVFPDGRIYDGNFKQGIYHGSGIFMSPSGCSYEGNFTLGKMDEKGKYTFSDGSIFEGYFTEGMMQGKGSLKCQDGEILEGEFKNGKFYGNKQVIDSIGNTCELNTKGDIGVITFSDGSVYEGEIKQNKCEGRGIMKYPGGSVYEGMFRNNHREGLGVYKDPEGLVFEGEWVNGNMDGEGTARFPDGIVYQGYFKNGQAEGKILIKYPNGVVHEEMIRSGNSGGLKDKRGDHLDTSFKDDCEEHK